jgi:hypothetical protein
MATAPGTTGTARISFAPALTEAQLNSTVTVTLAGDNISNLASVAAQLRYDPRILRINNIVAGDLSRKGLAPGAPLEPSKNILNDSGQADMSISRGAAGAVSGAGGLFTVVFQAVGRGDTTVAVSAVSLTGANGQAMGANTPPPLAVSVK